MPLKILKEQSLGSDNQLLPAESVFRAVQRVCDLMRVPVPVKPSKILPWLETDPDHVRELHRKALADHLARKQVS